ncbi:MAG: hypothetical protein ACE5JH_09460 [Acidobacteriota bacterium]
MRRRAGTGRLHLNARLVRERDRARARELRWLLLAAAAAAVPLLMYVGQRVEFIRLSYEVEALSRQKREQADLNKELKVERSMLRAPARIERLARGWLGFADPRPGDVRRVMLFDGSIEEIHDPVAQRNDPPERGYLAAGVLVPPADPRAEER